MCYTFEGHVCGLCLSFVVLYYIFLQYMHYRFVQYSTPRINPITRTESDDWESHHYIYTSAYVTGLHRDDYSREALWHIHLHYFIIMS